MWFMFCYENSGKNNGGKSKSEYIKMPECSALVMTNIALLDVATCSPVTQSDVNFWYEQYMDTLTNIFVNVWSWEKWLNWKNMDFKKTVIPIERDYIMFS